MKKMFFLLIATISMAAIPSYKETVETTDPNLILLNEYLPEILSKIPKIKGVFRNVERFDIGGKSFINDVYEISTDRESLVIKLGNTEWSNKKTINEISIIDFLREKTSLPLPQIYQCIDEKTISKIGREYLVMEKLEGIPMHVIYPSLADEEKEKILDQLADILITLRNFKGNYIGNFKKLNGNLQLIGIIDFPNKYIEKPCTSFSDYCQIMINYYVEEMEEMIREQKCREGIYGKCIEKLKKVVLLPFFTEEETNENFVLTHQDLVMKNILINKGEISAVLDWEWSAFAPKEFEALAGMDFLQTEKQHNYFKRCLEEKGASDVFEPLTKRRQLSHELLGWAYCLVAYKEWFSGKLLHTARFLPQKLYQRKVRDDPSITQEEVLEDILLNFDRVVDQILCWNES